MKQLPKEMMSLKLYDGRPAYIFADKKTGRFPLNEFSCDKKTCPYCGREFKDEECSCSSYKTVKVYNSSLE